MLKGNKPDFHNAMNSELSQPAYDNFMKLLGTKYRPEAVKGVCVCVCVCVCVRERECVCVSV